MPDTAVEQGVDDRPPPPRGGCVRHAPPGREVPPPPRTQRPPGQRGGRVTVRPLQALDEDRFLAAVAASRRLHRPWVSPPSSSGAFASYLSRVNRVTDFAFIIEEASSGDLVGVVNLTGVVRGLFQSGYLGYYGFSGMNGRGLMKEGLNAVVRSAFNTMGLHRVEANIQPGNSASIALVKACGFRREGYSPRYLKIGGRWRDHERWARIRGDP